LLASALQFYDETGLNNGLDWLLLLPFGNVGLLLLQEGEQVDTSQQGQKAPKNPITGEPLTPVTNKDKEGYQATVLAGQSEDTSARIMGQLDGQDGRPFGGRSKTMCDILCQARCALCRITPTQCAWERTAATIETVFTLQGSHVQHMVPACMVWVLM
jgi:hypothetical protein